MGRYRGILALCDEAGATLKIPYDIEKIFIAPFDTFPLSKEIWQPYITDDSLHIGFDYIDAKLSFTFKRNNNISSDTSFVAGIRSRFFIFSSFYVTIDFKLRDEMDDAFEAAFFVSSSADTGILK